MHESELTLPMQRGLHSIGVVEGISNRVKVELLRPKLAIVAEHIAAGELCILPGKGPYGIFFDGRNLKAVEKVREAKGRRPEQREAVFVPPNRLFDLMDFGRLEQINPDIDRKIIEGLYQANPAGLIVPCIKEKTPRHLITHHNIEGEQVPTILNVWISRYRILSILWKKLAKYPEVLLSGTSANLTGSETSLSCATARSSFGEIIAAAIQDPREAEWAYLFPDSTPILDLTKNPPQVVRKASADPVKYPGRLKTFSDILPELMWDI